MRRTKTKSRRTSPENDGTPNLKALYGLKYNPFSPEIPTDALLVTPQVDDFAYRLEHGIAESGGFALITGKSGTGKSCALRLVERRLERLRDVRVAFLERPQSGVPDFYREMGEHFGVPLRPHNRWAGFRALRERWLEHIKAALLRPILLIDEAQEMHPIVLNELRLLAQTRFDSSTILAVVFAGDDRLTDRLASHPDLLPLLTRIRSRLQLQPATPEQLRDCLVHRMAAAGNTKLMTPQVVEALCEHALGCTRTLFNMADEILARAVRNQADEIDETLFFELSSPPPKPVQKRSSRRRAAGVSR